MSDTNSNPEATKRFLFIKKILKMVFGAFFVFAVIIIIVALLDFIPVFFTAFSIISNYLQLILTSWPATILILGILLLLLHPAAIDDLIHRVIKAGPFDMEPPQQSEQSTEQLRELSTNGVTTEEAHTTSSTAQLREENTVLREQLESSTKTAIFERTYRVIFGGQLRMLQTAYYSPTGSIRMADALQIYSEVARAYPIIATNFPYPVYVNFLFEGGLLESVAGSDQIKITPTGREFLSYLNTHGIIPNKPF